MQQTLQHNSFLQSAICANASPKKLHLWLQAVQRKARKLLGRELLGAAVFQSSSARQWVGADRQLRSESTGEGGEIGLMFGQVMFFFFSLIFSQLFIATLPFSSFASLPCSSIFSSNGKIRGPFVHLERCWTFQKAKDSEWWVNTVDAVASCSTLEVLKDILSWFIPPVLRWKLHPLKLGGTYLTDPTFNITKVCDVSVTEASAPQEDPAQDTWKDLSIRSSWGFLFENQPCCDFWNQLLTLLEKTCSSRPLGNSWHWALSINHVLRGKDWYFLVDLFSTYSSSPSSCRFNYMAFPLQRWKLPPDFHSAKFPSSHQPVFDFIFWRLLSAYTMTWQHKWVPGTHSKDHPLQIFLYIVLWVLTCRIPLSLAIISLKYGFFSSLEMAQKVPILA